MLVLGIESSCDDTAASVVEDGSRVLSSVVSSQDEIHTRYGGVVPELASRRHIEMIVPVVEEALSKAGRTLDDLDGVAVTQGPGLVGSILVGLSFGKSLAYARGLPLTGVNHIAAHTLVAFLSEEGGGGAIPDFPFVSLIVSGGHTTLLVQKTFTEYEVLGQTRDDAAGEAFDKVAKLLGLGYPGGVAIDRLAREGDAGAVSFPRPYISKGNLDFSFSGLKTAVLNHVRSLDTDPGENGTRDIAASFQEAVVDVLVEKSLWALDQAGAKDLVVCGGVACNTRLRERLAEAGAENGARVFIPPPKFCSDNAAMIAALGFHQLGAGRLDDLHLNAKPTWEGF